MFSLHVQRIIRSEIDEMVSNGKTTGYIRFKTHEQAEHAISLLSENGYDVKFHNKNTFGSFIEVAFKVA